MQSKRQLQVAEMIKRNFGIVLRDEGSYIYGNEPFVTVTGVLVSPDLSQSKIYLSIYNIEDKQSVIILMDHAHHQLKQALVKRIRKHIRRIPEISFYQDETLDEMYRLNQLFDNLD
jgi:ribosome-binding factor A